MCEWESITYVVKPCETNRLLGPHLSILEGEAER